MSQYTYTLHPDKRNLEEKQYYKKSQLERMTTFQLREICRQERLVANGIDPLDRESFIRLVMRFRGRKEYRHIAEYCEGGMERIQDILNKMPVQISRNDRIGIPASLTLYYDMAVDEFDGYQAEALQGSLYEGNILIVDENLRVCTCGYIKEVQGKFWICKGKDVKILPPEKHHYSVLYFPAERISEYLYEQYYGMDSPFMGTVSCLKIPLLNLEVRTVEETQLPLVIDFGSCNTTMGICMPDGTRKIAVSGAGNVIPSVVGITGMRGEEMEYVFGYEATLLGQNNYQDQDIPVFYDIKRWISDASRHESVVLHNGVKADVCRKDMLKAFFEYLTQQARKQFKCQFRSIQLLAPVRQKEKFQELFQGLIAEVEIDCSLDEGMAVLFSSVDKLVAQETYEQNRWYRTLIIDCGGGTTDLTSGRFRIDSSRVSYNIDLETSYENGDTNFGGNNLTYRILQLLKIRICQVLTGADPAGDIGDPEEDYAKAEQMLPTAFKNYTNKERTTYFQVKNNYYYLFELAEQVKKTFFQPGFRYELWVGTKKEEDLFLDKWRISIARDGVPRRLDKTVRFPVYRHQVEELLRPDIYQLMERFLKPKFLSNELQGYDMIRLTGQSCKSRLFEEALKEYVPGMLIQRSGQETDGSELKMCCLEGALAYFFNCKLGYMNVNSNYLVGALPYEIMAYTHEGRAKTLIHSMDRDGYIGYISRFMVGKQLDIHLLDSFGEHLKTCYYVCDIHEFLPTTQKEIDGDYAGTVIQEETDTIQEGEMKFFIWVDRRQWGFKVMPVRRAHDLLYKGKELFFEFEDDTWEENFFDGRK